MNPVLILFLSLLAGCRPLPDPLPDTEVTLGWRLAPGMVLRYRSETRYEVGEDVVERTECWSYLVRGVDEHGVFTLEGRFHELDAHVRHAGEPLEPELFRDALAHERTRASLAQVRLKLSLDGRIDRLEAGDWSQALIHRMLALRLPDEPVSIGARWKDPTTARPATDLIPAEVSVTATGTQQLADITWTRRPHRDGRRGGLLPPSAQLEAHIHTNAGVYPQDARYPSLDITGETRWNLEEGLIDHRTLHMEERGRAEPEGTGLLHLSLSRIP